MNAGTVGRRIGRDRRWTIGLVLVVIGVVVIAYAMIMTYTNSAAHSHRVFAPARGAVSWCQSSATTC